MKYTISLYLCLFTLLPVLGQKQQPLVEHIEEKYNLILEDSCVQEPNKVGLCHTIEFSYPKLISSNPKIDSLINSKIISLKTRLHPYSHDSIRFQIDTNNRCDSYCDDNFPFYNFLDYQILTLNNQYFSVAFNFGDQACCGAHGSYYKTIYQTFDLNTGALLTLKDIATEHKELLNLLNSKLKKSFEDTDLESIDFFNLQSLEIYFGIEQDEIKIYVESPNGQGLFYSNHELTLMREEYLNLLTLKKTNTNDKK